MGKTFGYLSLVVGAILLFMVFVLIISPPEALQEPPFAKYLAAGLLFVYACLRLMRAYRILTQKPPAPRKLVEEEGEA